MTAMSNTEFAAMVRRTAQLRPFEPHADYDPDGDCVEFLFRPDSFRAERIDDLVTVYYSRRTGEIIGSVIKGVRRYCETVKRNLPGFVISVDDGRVRLEHLFLARMWTEGDKVNVHTYRKLAEAADAANASAALCVF